MVAEIYYKDRVSLQSLHIVRVRSYQKSSVIYLIIMLSACGYGQEKSIYVVSVLTKTTSSTLGLSVYLSIAQTIMNTSLR